MFMIEAIKTGFSRRSDQIAAKKRKTHLVKAYLEIDRNLSRAMARVVKSEAVRKI